MSVEDNEVLKVYTNFPTYEDTPPSEPKGENLEGIGYTVGNEGLFLYADKSDNYDASWCQNYNYNPETIMVYSLDNCPYCKLAIELIESEPDYQALVFKCGRDKGQVDKVKIKDNIRALTGKDVTTFPIILTSDMEFIGGYDDLEHYFHKKRTSKMLEEAQPKNKNGLFESKEKDIKLPEDETKGYIDEADNTTGKGILG